MEEQSEMSIEKQAGSRVTKGAAPIRRERAAGDCGNGAVVSPSRRRGPQRSQEEAAFH